MKNFQQDMEVNFSVEIEKGLIKPLKSYYANITLGNTLL